MYSQPGVQKNGGCSKSSRQPVWGPKPPRPPSPRWVPPTVVLLAGSTGSPVAKIRVIEFVDISVRRSLLQCVQLRRGGKKALLATSLDLCAGLWAVPRASPCTVKADPGWTIEKGKKPESLWNCFLWSPGKMVKTQKELWYPYCGWLVLWLAKFVFDINVKARAGGIAIHSENPVRTELKKPNGDRWLFRHRRVRR